MIPQPTFSRFFTALWGDSPFPWQTMLAGRIAGGHWPAALDLPTASGKTACMDIAIWALAQQADRPASERTAPRRIWFVVDRRIVVDEAYDRANKIARKLDAATDGPLATVANRLKDIGGTDRSLATARLRGGVLRDDGWARLPSQPAVITSTVDQLGSRLLFRGYGRSHLAAPIFAGLAAHDSLILLDEAHCSVPFLQTLRAVKRFRGEEWAEEPIRTPFTSVILSATPPPNIPKTDIFPGGEREQALDHPVLHVRRDASKPAELILIKNLKGHLHDPVVDKAVERARCYLIEHGKRRTAIIVNRVRTAMDVATRLRADLSDSVDVILLTGRLRPLERDCLVKRWKPFLRAKAPAEPERPVALVSTQCVEVGADFSFDALVTEAASLDALRQRFGRLNRLGKAAHSSAAILIREEDTMEGADDPIYGSSIAACWNLLYGHAIKSSGSRVIDFGIEAMDRLLAKVDDPSRYLAPTPDAPSLLPAHLDLLAQTSPVPHPDPDIQLFLHGIGRGVPEARVVWRSDLNLAHQESWSETVALCPPASTETLSMSLFQLRRWLAQSEDDQEGLEDVEGTARPASEPLGHTMRPVLRWAGRKHSKKVERTEDIRPNDLVVVPAGYGMAPSGQSEPGMAFGHDKLDLWEPARKATGRPAAVRLHPDVLKPWSTCCPPLRALVALAVDPTAERENLWDAVDTVIAYQPVTDEDPAAPPEWITDLLRATRRGRVEEHPDGGLVLFARRAQRHAEPDLFADDDDLMSTAGHEVPFAEHTKSVRRAVENMASRCLDETLLNPLALAASWHDTGKLDERFQIVLYQGNELSAAVGQPLAKSADIPSSPARRRAIQDASGLPSQFRHEMLSLQLAQRHAQLPQSPEERNLVLHLIASHHGYARPLAPVSFDADPPAVRGTWEDVTVNLPAAERAALEAPHSLASGIPERYGRLTQRYGWWGLAYVEAILRLGDWYGSQFTTAGSTGISDPPTKTSISNSTPSRRPATSAVKPLVLAGIDGANPLGFLAALGTLTVLHAAGYGEVRLGWKQSTTWQPVLSLTGLDATDRSFVARTVADALRGNSVEDKAEDARKETEKGYEVAKRALKRKIKEIRDRPLTPKERKVAIEAEAAPFRIDVARCRHEWRVALRNAVPSPELAIGKHLDCTVTEYREAVIDLTDSLTKGDREPLDFLAAFASDACLRENRDTLDPTPFCFIAGSGHQYFLDTIRQLIPKVDPKRVRRTLFEPWQYRDKTLSMRWDPTEVRRYALTDQNPSDAESRTMWMANLLAYRALALFPSAPRGRHLVATAWSLGGSNGDELVFTWPIWQTPIDFHTLRFLLQSADLAAEQLDSAGLRARSVLTTFRARRIKVGAGANYKINFSPAVRIG